MTETEISAGWTLHSAQSADGTGIGYRRYGSGPAVIVLHGGMQSSQYFTKLATELASTFTVIVPDRRGRGRSGPYGENFGIEREVEDVRALVAASGATRIFGLSSGALVSLRSTLEIPQLSQTALYEPPFSINGSVPTAWLPRYDDEIAAGKTAAALATSLKGLGVERVLGKLPRFVLAGLFAFDIKGDAAADPDRPSIAELIPTLHYDLGEIAEMSDTLDDYAELPGRVLLVGGSKSPKYLSVALNGLETVIPRVRRVRLRGLDHSGPDDGGDPGRVAIELREFFRE